MIRLWPSAVLIGIAVALLFIAPMAQACTYWSDGSACASASVLFIWVGVLVLIAGLGLGYYLFSRGLSKK